MQRARTKSTRSKLSTTIAPENYEFLEFLVRSGRVQNISEALDAALTTYRKLENRRRLEQATTEYFNRLSPKAVAEEDNIGDALASGLRDVDFDAEP